MGRMTTLPGRRMPVLNMYTYPLLEGFRQLLNNAVDSVLRVSYYAAVASKKKETAEDPGLGELETDVMKIVWTSDWPSVRDVYEALRRERSIAYTTVMTVMGRLHEKGMLDRKQDGRTYLYQARQSRGQVARSFMQKLLDRLFDGRKADAMAALLDAGDKLDDAELGQIKKQLEEMEKKGSRRG